MKTGEKKFLEQIGITNEHRAHYPLTLHNVPEVPKATWSRGKVRSKLHRTASYVTLPYYKPISRMIEIKTIDPKL